jgi:hypothetical protein
VGSSRSAPTRMNPTFSEAPPERSQEVLDFLCRVFGIQDLPPNLRPEMQAWKYFARHPWSSPVRSYILETENGIAAHGCVAPVRFAWGERTLDSMVIIDWAAGTQIPGAGLLVYRRCMEVEKCSLLAIGGSHDTLRILPQVRWFAPKTDMRWFARPMRPWQRFLRSQKAPADGLKLLRNLSWKQFPGLPAAGNWACRPARSEDPVFTPSGDFVPLLRTREWIDYLSACPVAKCQLWILQQNGVACGHALTANLQGSVRVADWALAGKTTPELAAQAFSALVRTLAADETVVELVAGSSLESDIHAFEACGLRPRRGTRILLADRYKVFPPDAQLEIKPMLGDSFYLYDPANPFRL